MSYQVLARKWRPQTFKDLVGQEHVVQALVNGLDQDRLHHAFLLSGTRGVGKTTIARILARCLNCETGVTSTPCGECSSCTDISEGRFVDMLEIDAASKTKVEDTRELLQTVQYAPTRGRYKVYIIDEVHMLSGHSFNALLKTLEEPPPHVKFVLATTDPQKLPVTILSRCLRFNLTRLLPDQIKAHLEHILKTDSVAAEGSAIMRIARAADGSMRDGLSLLDQAISYGGGSLKDADVAKMLGSIDYLHVAAIIDALLAADAPVMLGIVDDLIKQSRNVAAVLSELAEAMHRIALLQVAPDFRDPERSDWDSLKAKAAQLTPEDAQLYYQIAITGSRDLELAPDPRTGLEMTLLRMLAFRPVTGNEAVAAKTVAGGGGAASKTRADFEAMQDAVTPTTTVTASTDKTANPGLVAGSAANQGWPDLQAGLNLSGAARELARNIQLQSTDQHNWKFLLPETLEHLGSKSVIQSVQSAIATHLGHAVSLEIHIASSPVQSLAATSEQLEKSRINEAERAIEEDVTVQEIKKKFGAKIVPDSVHPLQ